jgi:hypothetical protein
MPEDVLLEHLLVSRLVNCPPSTYPGSSTEHALSGVLPFRAAYVISTFSSQFLLHHDGVIFHFTYFNHKLYGMISPY